MTSTALPLSVPKGALRYDHHHRFDFALDEHPQFAIAPGTRKILAFTDNRQDAALQAGHFNDFLFVTLLRGAILAGLTAAGDEGLQDTEIGQAIQRMGGR